MRITAQCECCVGAHVQTFLDAGATDAGIKDVCKVAMLMGGGPAMAYFAEVHEAVELYRSKQAEVA